jgi:hypothetical protein
MLQNLLKILNLLQMLLLILVKFYNYQNIINVKDPILPPDAATKKYIDDLGISIANYTLSNTLGSLISTNLSGSFVITVKNLA